MFLNFFYFTPTVVLGERVVSHDSTQGRYFLKRKPDYESLNIEVDRAYTPGECDIVHCDGATMYFSSAAYPSDNMRMSAGAT